MGEQGQAVASIVGTESQRTYGSTASAVRTRVDVAACGHRRPLFVVTAEIRELARSPRQRVAKRIIDISGALLVLALMSPLFVVTMLAVRLSGPGPIFFVQDRCGISGRLFRFYKFRTMVVDAEARKAELAHLNEIRGAAFKIKNDPRITRIGSWLRKLSIDELPQLWNVIKGDMSLVGPRPPTPDEVTRYTRRQVQRLAVIPGISGLWQVSGRSSIPDFDRWIELDLQYAQTWSIWRDLDIMMRTPLAVLRMRGAA
jgi:lipopolysaccharide/colanic/teichoic acid biosynthesis glycosyltransferase